MIGTLILKPESNLSVAWAKAFIELKKPPVNIRHPVVITINGFDTNIGVEDTRIRNRLDAFLKIHKQPSCKTVSGTIFPTSLWNENVTDNGAALFERYKKVWPGIKKCNANRNGVYFQRLTAFLTKNSTEKPVNQLEKIITTYGGGNHRKSALQAAIFDPTRDHTNQKQRGFPCLQQVTFTPLGNGELSITGFYAKQLHLEKAYGNYLGLYELGRFMAKQMGLKLTQVVCIASCLQTSKLNGADATASIKILKNDIEMLLADYE